MLNLFTRLVLGFMLLLSAVVMIYTHDSGLIFPFVLFPIGMIISGFGTFLHGPMDPEPKSFADIPISEKIGIVLLLIGVVSMVLAAVLKAFS